MNDNEFDLVARAWLDDGPNRMSDRAVLSTLEMIHTTPRRRTWRPAWRTTPEGRFAGVAIAAVLVVAVGTIAINVIPRQPNGSSVGGPSPSSSPAQAVVPAPDTTFVSPTNGFSIEYYDRGEGTLTLAKQLWGFSKQSDDGFDVVETGSAAVFKGASSALTMIGSGGSIDARVDAYLSDDSVLRGGCGVPRTEQAEITIDGQAGRISECPNEIEATVVFGGRLYLFTLSNERSDARAIFDAFVATIVLTPETAVDFPAMTTTFVSPTYGYSFRYHDRGGLAPATERWNPGDDQIDDIQASDRFDAVETGMGAYFVAASTAIPDGVSVDRWVDENVSPSGCRVPRSQQAEITIDGQSGRIAECPNLVEATVVAGGRLYLFMLGHGRSDARAFFDAWVATIDLRPEDAAAPGDVFPAGAPGPSHGQPAEFEGTWSATDAPIDRSHLTMEIVAQSDGRYDVTMLDDYASVCAGGSSTMTGVAEAEGPGTVVIGQPGYRCDDGTQARALSLGDPPLEDQLKDLAFHYDFQRDALQDSMGLAWTRVTAG